MNPNAMRDETANAENAFSERVKQEAERLSDRANLLSEKLEQKAAQSGHGQGSLAERTAHAAQGISERASKAADMFAEKMDARADKLREKNEERLQQPAPHQAEQQTQPQAPIAAPATQMPRTSEVTPVSAPLSEHVQAPLTSQVTREVPVLQETYVPRDSFASQEAVLPSEKAGLSSTLETSAPELISSVPTSARLGDDGLNLPSKSASSFTPETSAPEPISSVPTSARLGDDGLNLPSKSASSFTPETSAPEPTSSVSSSARLGDGGLNLSSKPASSDAPSMAPGGKVRLTNYPTIKNAVLPVEGNGSFNNVHLALLIAFGPAVLLRLIPFVKASWFGWWSYLFLVILLGVPFAIAYWTVMSMVGPRINEKVTLPNRPIEDYLEIHAPELRRKYTGYNKIPMQVFWDAYIDGKIDVKGDLLDVLEYRWDWAAMHFTPELFRYVLFNMLPDVLTHSSRQDEEQIRDNYDRGNDFHEWFLGPLMVYTSGVISDPHREESLEEMQENKMELVCSKLALKPGDRVLDIGCGWGTLAAFAAKNYGADVTGVTLAKEQAQFGNERLRKNGVSPDQARILCEDYRDIPVQPGHYNKIVSLEMAEHVGIRHYAKFLQNVYNLLDDDGVMVFQVAGLRPRWQYWDLIWGLFMNKYIFPGADASCPLNWVIGQLERAGFEIRSCDVAGIHYSATILRWLNNWHKNEAQVKAKYGEKQWRIWHFFLASSVIIAREGGSSVFQITVTKNLNATHRIEGIESHGNMLPRPSRGAKWYQSVI